MARVLIIDDDEQVRSAHLRTLRRAGYKTNAVASVQAGIEAARDRRADVILLDLVMPDTRGLDALKLLKNDPATRDAVVIAFSGVIVESDAERFRELGFDAILPKPLGGQALVARLAELLEERRRAG